MAKTTLQTIANRLGVSRMTVSNAFSRPDQLSAELRQRILETAAALGYVGPDPAARALARGTTGAVGVLLTDSLAVAFADEVATTMLRAVVEELAPSGLALTLLTTSDDGLASGRNGAGEHPVPARDVAIDGAIVYSCKPESPARDWLLRRELPLVLVDQDPLTGISSVNVDDRGGAAAAAELILGLGHRHVGLRVEPLGHPQRERLDGWLGALGAAGVTPTVVQVDHEAMHAGSTAALEGPVARALDVLLEVDPGITAVLCFSDALAVAVISAAEQLGRRVPDDLSVVGFDDSPLAAAARPRLTTVRQDSAAKGRLAAQELLNTIERARGQPARGGKATGPRRAKRHVLPTELVVRESTARPPDSCDRV